jgi:hypothetical protein
MAGALADRRGAGVAESRTRRDTKSACAVRCVARRAAPWQRATVSQKHSRALGWERRRALCEDTWQGARADRG